MASRKTKSARRKSRPNPQIPVQLGPWFGVRDVAVSGEQDPRYLQDAINCVFENPTKGGAAFARPGFRKATTSTALGTGTGFVACIHSLHVAPNTIANVGQVGVYAIVDTKVYRNTGSGTTWADVTPVSGPTINTSTRYAVTGFSNDEIIFAGMPSGSLTQPWIATDLGAANITGANIAINAAGQAWVARNSPTIHGGKVFFPVHSINSVVQTSLIVWSEEADPTTGYLQSGFTNSWELFQTNTQPLTAILGTEAGLYYFRENSIGLITGTVNADFVTSSTRDAVSEKVGHAHTNYPPILANDYVWFRDSEGKPWRFRVGSKVMEPIWEQMRGRFAKVEQTTASENFGPATYIKDLNKVVMSVLYEADDSAIFTRNLYVFDADTGNYEGRWLVGLTDQPDDEVPSVVQVTALHGGQSATSSPDHGAHVLWIGGNLPGTSIASPGANDRGHVYVQYAKKDYNFGDVSAAMHFSATTHLVPESLDGEFQVDEVRLGVVPDTVAVNLDYYAQGSATGLSATPIANSDSVQSTYDHGRCVWGLGPNAQGRWFRAVFWKNVSSGSTQHVFERGTALVRVRPASPFAP